MKVFIHIYGFSKGIHLNILIMYGKDPNFKKNRLISYCWNYLPALFEFVCLGLMSLVNI